MQSVYISNDVDFEICQLCQQLEIKQTIKQL